MIDNLLTSAWNLDESDILTQDRRYSDKELCMISNNKHLMPNRRFKAVPAIRPAP